MNLWEQKPEELMDVSIPPRDDETDILYRCDISVYEHGLNLINFEYYPIIRRTPQGAWIDVYGRSKFVLLTALKKWACETKPQALRSFIARKQKQIKILNHQIETTKRQLSLAKDFKF